MSKKSMVAIGLVVMFVILGVVVAKTAVGYIDAKEWVFVQPYAGTARIQNGSGLYWKGFAKVYPYPRYMEFVYSDDAGEGDIAKESIKLTFNDGSTADMDAFIVIQTPDSEEDQLNFHKLMNGSPETVKSKTKAYLTECLKSTGPLMSSTEHQVSRKSDFSRKVEDQLTDGIYEMKQVRKVLIDRVDEKGEPVYVDATEIVRDEITGKPVIAKVSPLTVAYKMKIVQFSIKGTVYDAETLLQFAAKKAQFLNAETSKSEREAMVQEALKIEAEGLKDKAQAEADANVLKASAVIAAEQKAEVAEQAKIEAETKAEQALSVAKTAQEEAQVKLDIAILDAEAMIELAKAEQERIRLAGAITELEQAQIDARVLIGEAVAKGFGTMSMPTVWIAGGGDGAGEAGGDALTAQLFNMKLIESMGLLDIAAAKDLEVKRTIARDVVGAATK